MLEKKTEKHEKTSNNEIIVLLQSTCSYRIFILLLQIGPRSKNAQNAKEADDWEHDTGLVMQQSSAR
jgi:hypothetical protein